MVQDAILDAFQSERIGLAIKRSKSVQGSG